MDILFPDDEISSIFFLSFFLLCEFGATRGNDGNMCEYGYLVIAPEFNLLSLGLLFVAFNIKETEFLSSAATTFCY